MRHLLMLAVVLYVLGWGLIGAGIGLMIGWPLFVVVWGLIFHLVSRRLASLVLFTPDLVAQLEALEASMLACGCAERLEAK